MSSRTPVVLLLCILLFLPVSGFETPVLVWERFLGGGHSEIAYSVQETLDNGYIVAGFSCSEDGQVTFTGLSKAEACEDFWIVKLDSSGDLQWERSLGGTGFETVNSVDRTSDGGCIVAGSTWSNDGNVTGHHGGGRSYDYWIVRLDPLGDLVWEKSYGGFGHDEPRWIRETPDRGFIVVGYSESNDGDVSPNHPQGAVWIIKLDKGGDLVWQKSLANLNGSIRDIKDTSNHGFVLAGEFRSPCHSSVRCPPPNSWICKLDENGTVLWEKTFGGSDYEIAWCIRESPDKGFIIVGSTVKTFSNWTPDHRLRDTWVRKLDEEGNQIWQTSLGGFIFDYSVTSVLGTREGGYIVTTVKSQEGEVSQDPFNEADITTIKLDPRGTIICYMLLDRGDWTRVNSLIETSDNCVVIAGNSFFRHEPVLPSHHGTIDFYVAKLGMLKSIPYSDRVSLDPDQDGIYEDIDGDGEVTLNDLLRFYRYMDWISRYEPVPCFDYNGDKKISIVDGFHLFSSQ